MNRLLLACVAAVFLSACGSSVKLDDVPVEDKTGAAVTGQGGAANGVGTGQVASVDLNKSAAEAAMQAVNRLVYFDYDSYVIRPEFQSLIDAQARFLRMDAQRKIVIEGHTDERGGREYNLALGQKRAEAVRRALMLLGVTEAQIEAVSFGKEKPAAQGASEEAMAKNRRAEIVYR